MTRFLSLTLLASFTVSSLFAEEDNADQSVFDKMIGGFGKLQSVGGNLLSDSTKEVHKWRTTMEGQNANGASLSRPHMAMADAAGNIYIADKDAHGIRKIDLNGKITTIAGLSVDTRSEAQGNGADNGLGIDTQLSFPNGLYTLLDGTTYILDTGNQKIRKLTTDGMLSTIIEDPADFGTGRGLWVSADEDVIFYSAGTRVKRWTPGNGIETWATGFSSLGNFDVDPTDGTLVVTDRGGNRVYRIIPNGNPPYNGRANPIAGTGLASAGTSGVPALNCGLNEVRGIAFRSDGTYFLATHRGSQVWFVDHSDTIHLVIDGDRENAFGGDGEPLTTGGEKISEPRSITLAPNGDLLICENDRGLIRRVTNICVDPVVANFDLTEGGRIEWSSHRDASYRLESSPNLSAMSWTPIMTMPGSNGATTSVENFTSDMMSDSAFYRVVEIETP